MTKRKETIRFSSSVAPGITETETMVLAEDATVEQVDVRFYRGPELYLEVLPFVQEGLDSERVEREPLVEVFGRTAVIGDSDHFVFQTDVPVRQEEILGVEVANTTDQLADDQQHSYDYIVDITVDYEGGTSRWLPSFLSGVFA